MTQSILARLLKYPHAAVFDPSPAPELALRIRNPAGLVWTIDGQTLKLEVGQNAEWNGAIEFNGSYDWGLTLREYPLADKTVGQLADELRADGHEVVFENPDIASRGARVLISGIANQDDTNGDHLNGFTSLLWVLMGAYAGEVAEAEYQSGQALRQMVMTQAEAEWLDVWAALYGVPRQVSEADAQLQLRIPQEVFRARVNGLAIEQAIADLADQSVTIDEPWKRMFTLDESAMSGAHRLQDGQYYTYHVIQPVGAEGTNWARVYPVLERNKAAGIEIYAPRVDFPAWEVTVQPPVEYRIERGRMDTRGGAIWGAKDMVLGEMRLSAHGITINHPCNRLDWWVVFPESLILYEGRHTYDGEATYGDPLDAIHVGLQSHQRLTPYRSIAMASIPLSDGDPLGDENAILSRGVERVEFDPEPVPSDIMFLSGYDAERVVERVEVITITENVAGAESAFVASGEVQRTDGRVYASNEAYPVRTWSGAWDGDRWLPEWRVAGMAMSVEVGTLDFNYDGRFEHDGLYQYIGYRGY